MFAGGTIIFVRRTSSHLLYLFAGVHEPYLRVCLFEWSSFYPLLKPTFRRFFIFPSRRSTPGGSGEHGKCSTWSSTINRLPEKSTRTNDLLCVLPNCRRAMHICQRLGLDQLWVFGPQAGLFQPTTRRHQQRTSKGRLRPTATNTSAPMEM